MDTSSVPARKGTGYPSPFDEPCAARARDGALGMRVASEILAVFAVEFAT
jgi:uncharacterized cupin superfamily protein